MYSALFVSLTTVIFCFVWLKGEGGSSPLRPLKYRDHPLKDLYPFGYGILEIFPSRGGGVKERREERYFKSIYGNRHWEFYRRMYAAERISTSAVIIIAFSLIASVLSSFNAMVLGAGFSICSSIYFDKKIDYLVTVRKNNIMADLPEVLSKLTLLIGAGMVIREAWHRVGESGEGVLYKEMQRASYEVKNGVREFDAYLGVSSRCGVIDVDKFTSAFVQNLSKGSGDMTEFLNQASRDSWNARKSRVRMSGEIASTKLLIPISLMFVGVFIMIMYPIMSGLTF